MRRFFTRIAFDAMTSAIGHNALSRLTMEAPSLIGCSGALRTQVRHPRKVGAIKSSKRVCCAAAALVGIIGSASAQHLDIAVYVVDGAIRVGGYDFDASPRVLADYRVFETSFEALQGAPGVVITDDPGWNAVASDDELPPDGARLPGNRAVGVDALSHPAIGRNLAYWDGTGSVAFGEVPGGEVLRYYRGSSASTSMTLDGGSTDVPGFDIGTTSPTGSLHRHPLYALYGSGDQNDFSTDAPTPGVYLATFQARVSGSPLPSNPFWVVFGLGASANSIQAAKSYVQAAVVPEPSTAVLIPLGVAALVYRRHVRARNSNIDKQRGTQ